MRTPEASRPVPGRSLVVVLLAVYLVLLVWAVLWKLEPPWTGGERFVKLVPFVRTATSGPSTGLEAAANVALFVPFGVHLGLLVRARPAVLVAIVTLVVAAASTALEVAQYVLGVGRSDVSDVLTNTAGGLLGLVVLAAVRAVGGTRATSVVRRACAAATVVGVLAAGLYALSPVRLVHVHDVGSAAGVLDDRAPRPAPPGG